MTDEDQPNTPENPGSDASADEETLRDAPSSGFRDTEVPGTPGLGTPGPEPASRPVVPPPLPDVLDGYRMLGEIGRGGMGSVHMAVRTDDAFKKRVAIKVMRLGLDTEDMLARFHLERQVLGAINHPNIARVFDAGVTPDGRPYFVMELVEGKPIDRYCDDNALTVAARLELFRKVCAAVHVAHQNLVVHRDIKPANILVTPEGEPKLLDFGIAKLLNPDLAAIDPMTRADQRLLTYEYASPEQVTGDPITTASDVYALGVLLYELLTGHRPYELTKRVYEEAVRVICSTEPHRPSTAVSRAITTRGPGDSVRTITGEEIARRREMQLARLKRSLSGDLDNIVLKAMRKTPGRRYVSAEDLASDIERHLTGQTVTARPPTWDYRAGKFLRRHKGGVAAAAIIAISLVAGTVATTWQWTRAEREARVAQARYENLRELTRVFDDIEAGIERYDGNTEARRVIADALVETLQALDAATAGDDQLKLDLAAGYRRAGIIAGREAGRFGDGVEHLERADAILAGLPDNLPGRDAESARVNFGLARALDRVGDPDEAADRARTASALALEAAKTDDPVRLSLLAVEAYELLAWTRRNRNDAETATAAARSAMEVAQDLRDRYPDRPESIEAVALAHEAIGRVHMVNAEPALAVESFTKAIDARRPFIENEPDAEHLRRVMVLHERRGREYVKLDQPDLAAADFDRFHELGQRYLEQDPFSDRAFIYVARAYEASGDLWYGKRDYDRAEAAYEQFRARSQRGVELDPLSRQRQRMLALAQKKLGDVQYRRGAYADAVPWYRRSLATYLPLLEADPENTRYRFDELLIGYFMGLSLENVDDADGALRSFERGLATGNFLLGLPNVEGVWTAITAECARGVARQLIDRGDGPRAVELLARAQDLRPSSTWNTRYDEARAARLVGDADTERARLQEVIAAVAELDQPPPDDATAALEDARARLAELGVGG